MPPSVAIIMRAKNEMPYVQRALEQLQMQTFCTFDLFAIDSGSTDGTLQALENSSGHLTQIRPEQYVPGKILNDAISRTDHDIIVLLNADAIPSSEHWLERLLFPIRGDRGQISFCKQIPRTNAPFMVEYDYERAYRRESMQPDFFSAVACAFKREVWNKQPFPETGYAEDARWASIATRGGLTIEYVDDCAVEHSHNYTLQELFKKRYRQALVSAAVPNSGKQILQCGREFTRDLMHALRKFKLQTIPYNIAYRVTIHRAVYKGLKDHE